MAKQKQKQKKQPPPPAAPPHLASRVDALRQRLPHGKTDALLVTNDRDIRYLTGFVGHDSYAVVPLKKKAKQVYILSDFRFDEQIQREAPHAVRVIRSKGMAEELAKLSKQSKLRTLAVQPGHVTLATRKRLAKEVGKKHLVEVEDGLLRQRAVKGVEEVAAIRKALGIQQQAFRETLAFMKPGQTEAEVAAYLDYRMRSLGADAPAFSTIVAAGANASLPHAIPGSAKLKQGDIVLIDWGARWGGYCGDLTRVVALGKMPAKIREIYAVALEAQQAAIAMIKPGVAMKDVDTAARDIIAKAGYGDRFGHGLGHGIGLDIHEEPVLSQRSDGTLQPGHIVTVEPGIYLPGVGGVRIEDDVRVTEAGHEVLSDLPKDLDSAII